MPALLPAQATINWTNNYGGTKSEAIRVIKPALNGNYWIGANSASKDTQVTGHSSGGENGDVWLYQVDSAGNFLFAADCLGGNNTEETQEIIVKDDGSLLVIAETYSSNEEVTYNHGEYDAWIIHTDSAGNLLWQKCFGGDRSDAARDAIRAIENDGYVFAGYAGSSLNGDITNYNPGYLSDLWFWKMDEDSTIMWQSYFGGSSFEWTYSIDITPDGNYISAASSGSIDEDVTDHHGASGISDIWVVKFDVTGNLIWSKSIGGSADDYVANLAVTSDGGSIITGFSYSSDGDAAGHHGDESTPDLFVVKLGADGNLEWSRSFGGSDWDSGADIIEKEDGYLVTGNTYSNDGDVTYNAGDADLWLLKLDFGGNLIWQQTYGGSKFDAGRKLLRKGDEYYLGGNSYSADGDITAHIGGIDNNKSDCWLLNLHICDIPTTSSFGYSADYLNVSFENLSAYADSNYWDFGDGSFSIEENPEHEFAAAGDYNVCLISYGHCKNDTACQMINVADCTIETAAGFTFESEYLDVIFSDTSINADSVLWDFGDGSFSTLNNPAHNYSFSGIYDVCLLAYGTCANDTACFEIAVTSCDIVTISNYSFVSTGLSVSFTDLSENAETIDWDFGDGFYSSDINPVHNYMAVGVYAACQLTSGECNADTNCKTITVEDDIAVENLPANKIRLIPLGNGVFEIISAGMITKENVFVSDISGKAIPFTTDNAMNIDISKAPQGMYFLSIILPGNNISFKLIR